MELYQEMNEKIVGLLRMSDEPMYLYAAARIEQLETELSEYRKAGRTLPSVGDKIFQGGDGYDIEVVAVDVKITVACNEDTECLTSEEFELLKSDAAALRRRKEQRDETLQRLC